MMANEALWETDGAIESADVALMVQTYNICRRSSPILNVPGTSRYRTST
jgi:hypothetical protein